MKFLVTGGAGFIGSAVVLDIINDTGNSAVNVDKLTYAGNLESLLSVSDRNRYQFEQVDICDMEELDRILLQHRLDIVMHLAAKSHVYRSIDGPGAFIETNIIGSYTLFETTRNYWQGLDESKQCKFWIHNVSTDEVHGALGLRNELSIEESTYAPSSPYSASKASSDHQAREGAQLMGFR